MLIYLNSIQIPSALRGNSGRRMGLWQLLMFGPTDCTADAQTTAASTRRKGGPYGGSDPSDSSGVLQYVRVWHGGAIVGADNELNGFTLGGVGSGTVLEHCEVDFNLDE